MLSVHPPYRACMDRRRFLLTSLAGALAAPLALRAKLPALYLDRDVFSVGGGLISYGPDWIVMFERAAQYVDRILKGARPGDLPVEQPSKFDLVINLKTAQALGLTIPQSLLLRADQVIQ
jgi:ABC-type uncharacterized transport system substrate-binding protein